MKRVGVRGVLALSLALVNGVAVAEFAIDEGNVSADVEYSRGEMSYEGYATLMGENQPPVVVAGLSSPRVSGEGDSVPVFYALPMIVPQGWKVLGEDQSLLTGVNISWHDGDKLVDVLASPAAKHDLQFIVDDKAKVLAVRKRENPMLAEGVEAPKPFANEWREFYVPFANGQTSLPPGGSSVSDVTRFLEARGSDVDRVIVTGYSVSKTAAHGTKAKAMARAEALKTRLMQAGLSAPAGGIELEAVAGNNAPDYKTGAGVRFRLLRTEQAHSLEPNPIVAAELPATSLWQIKKNDTLRATLQAWADEAGWQLVWDFPWDYGLSAGATFSGPFDMAVEQVINHMHYDAGKPIGAQISMGNKVIRIIPVE